MMAPPEGRVEQCSSGDHQFVEVDLTWRSASLLAVAPTLFTVDYEWRKETKEYAPKLQRFRDGVPSQNLEWAPWG